MAIARKDRPDSRERRHKHRLYRYRIWAIVLGALLLWSAPSIVSRTALLGVFINGLTSDMPGHVEYESASLGWFRQAEIRGLRFLDDAGQWVAKVESVRLQKNLWQLLWSRSDIGGIRLERPQLRVSVEESTSNVERLFSPLIPERSEGAALQYRVDILDGAVILTNPLADAQVQANVVEIDKIQCGFESGESQKFTLTARIWQDLETSKSGSLAFRSEASGSMGPRRISGEFIDMDLALLTHVAQRLGWEMSAEGRVSGNLEGQISRSGSESDWRWSEVSGQDFALHWPEVFKDDRPRLEKFESRGRIKLSGSEIQVEGLHFDSKMVSVDASGTMDLSDVSQLWNSKDPVGLEASGELDLAAVTTAFPSSLKLRKGVEVDSGKLQWLLRSQHQSGQRRLFANLSTGMLSLTNQGQSMMLSQPLSVSAAVINRNGKIDLEFVSCKSPFLRIDGRGTPNEGSITLAGNFNQLQENLRQVFAIDHLELGGALTGKVNWVGRRSSTSDQGAETGAWTPAIVHLNGDLAVRDLRVTWQGRPVLTEPDLKIACKSQFKPDSQFEEVLAQSALQLVADDDRLEIWSDAGMSEANQPEQGAVATPKFALTGNLQRWSNRLGIGFLLTEIEHEGDIEATGQLNWSPDSFGLSDASVTLRSLKIRSQDMEIQEGLVVGNCSLAYDRNARFLKINALTLASTSASLRVDQMVIPTLGSPETMQGQYAVRADLGRVSQWMKDSKNAAWVVGGQLEGNGQLSMQSVGADGEPLGFDFNGRVKDLSVSEAIISESGDVRSRPSWTWEEPVVTVAFQGTYDFKNPCLNLPLGEVVGSNQRVSASGSLSLQEGEWWVDASGSWRGLGHPWFKMFSPWLGEDAELKGEFDEPFFIEGPLAGLGFEGQVDHVRPVGWSEVSLSGEAGLAWQSGRVLGMPFGTGAIRPVLSKQRIDFGEVHIPLSQGDVRLQAGVQFDKDHTTIQVSKGRILDRVVLSPELSRRWLKYLSPLLAQVTQSEGVISLELQPTSIPLQELDLAEGSGVFEVERAVVGPGPLAMQLLTLISQIQSMLLQRPAQSLRNDAWIEFPKQKVAFQIERGRVYHDQMHLRLAGATVLTTGSVGHDETIDLVMSIPLEDRWLGNRPELAAFRGLSLALPIRGTLSSPKIDSSALKDLSKQLVRQAAEQLIDQQLRRGLESLLGGDQ